MNKFALFDAGNAMLSAHYFLNTGHALPPTARKVAAINIADALRVFDIPVPKELKKQASFEGRVAPFVDLNDPKNHVKEQVKVAHLPGNAKTEVEKFLDGEYLYLDPLDRMEKAASLYDMAKLAGVGTDGLDNFCGPDYGDSVYANIGTRKRFATPEQWGVYQKIASAAVETAPEPVKLASVLEETDREFGLDRHWDAGVVDPVSTVFYRSDSFRKLASAGEIFDTGSGSITESELSSIIGSKFDEVEGMVGSDAAHRLSGNLSTEFKALPDPLKQMISGLA